MRRLYLWILITLLVLSQRTLASNGHEHYDLMAMLKTLRAVSTSLNGGTEFDRIPGSQAIVADVADLAFVLGQEKLKQWLGVEIQGRLNHRAHSQLVDAKMREYANMYELLQDLARLTNRNVYDLRDAFFQPSPALPQAPSQRSYDRQLWPWKRAFSFLRAKFGIAFDRRLIRQYRRDVNILDRLFLSLTVAKVGDMDYGTEFNRFLETIKGAFLNGEEPTIVEIFLSIARHRMADRVWEGFRGFREEIASGRADGIDIVGGIDDEKSDYIKAGDQELFEQNLARTVAMLAGIQNTENQRGSGRRIALRAHMYQGSHTASYDRLFYESFWRVLMKAADDGALPGEIIMGHSSGLDQAGLANCIELREKMKEHVPESKIIFNLNVESNKVVKGFSYEELVAKIHMLHANNFTVYLGADGLAMLGEESLFRNTLMNLRRAGLSDESLWKLIEDVVSKYAAMQPGVEVDGSALFDRIFYSVDVCPQAQDQIGEAG